MGFELTHSPQALLPMRCSGRCAWVREMWALRRKKDEEGHVHKKRRAETGSEPLLHRFSGNGKGKRGDKRERKVKDNQDNDTLCKSSKSYVVKQGRTQQQWHNL